MRLICTIWESRPHELGSQPYTMRLEYERADHMSEDPSCTQWDWSLRGQTTQDCSLRVQITQIGILHETSLCHLRGQTMWFEVPAVPNETRVWEGKPHELGSQRYPMRLESERADHMRWDPSCTQWDHSLVEWYYLYSQCNISTYKISNVYCSTVRLVLSVFTMLHKYM